MALISKDTVPEKELPGRNLRWYVTKNGGEGAQASALSSLCVARVFPGQIVTPAHAHPNGEELIYVVSGKGAAYVNGIIFDMEAGDALLFEKGSIHQVRNTGNDVLEMACFYGPATDVTEYKFYPDVNFDSGERRK